MVDLLLIRKYPKPTYTIGELEIGGRFFSSTLEDTDRALDQCMTLASIKAIKKANYTAIPKGRYRVTFTYSPKFASKPWATPYGGKVLAIENVPGFDGVRIHPGNNASQTSGCVLVGLNKIKGGLVDSQDTYLELVDRHILPALAAGEEIWITIK